MNKQEWLQQLSEFVQKGEITKDEILVSYDDALKAFGAPKLENAPSSKISAILTYIGSVVIVLGIGLFTSQQWATLSTLSRIAITLGSGLAAYLIGVLLINQPRFEAIAQAFFLISALVIPVGLIVVFHEVPHRPSPKMVNLIIPGSLFGIYLFSYLLFRKALFVIFNSLFGTYFYISVVYSLLDGKPIFEMGTFTGYLFLSIGLMFSFLAYHFSRKNMDGLSGPLYGMGSFLILICSMLLGKWYPEQNVFWELLFPSISFGILYLSIYLKSRAFLINGAIFIMAYILKISAEYFSQSVGWPLTLMACGFLLIGIGYFTFDLNKKYLTP